jgi:hypothetical protein
MDPQERFCHNERCWAYGRAGEGHIVIHSQKERRYRCKRCTKTFSETKGTALYRSHKPHELVATVVTLLAYGCPLQAIVAAFGLDERTRSPAGNAKAGGSANGSMNTLSRPEGCFWRRSRPTNCVSGSSAAFCGWPRRFRLRAGYGWAAWCRCGATAA